MASFPLQTSLLCRQVSEGQDVAYVSTPARCLLWSSFYVLTHNWRKVDWARVTAGLATSQRVTIVNKSGKPLTLSCPVWNEDLKFNMKMTQKYGKAGIQAVSNKMQWDESSHAQLNVNSGKVPRGAAMWRAPAGGSLGARTTVWPPHGRRGLTPCLCPQFSSLRAGHDRSGDPGAGGRAEGPWDGGKPERQPRKQQTDRRLEPRCAP